MLFYAENRFISVCLRNYSTELYGKGFDAKNIHCMMKFAALYPDKQIVAPLVRQLLWSHILLIIPSTTSFLSHHGSRPTLVEARTQSQD